MSIKENVSKLLKFSSDMLYNNSKEEMFIWHMIKHLLRAS